MFLIPLPRRAYFGTPNDAPGRVEAAGRNRKLNRAYASQKKLYNALLELESLDENGLTEAGLQQLRIRLNDMNLQASALIDDVEQVIETLRSQKAESIPLAGVSRDDAAANMAVALGMPTPLEVLKGGR